jgi:uncharacterized membrane protein (UPF0127 family)
MHTRRKSKPSIPSFSWETRSINAHKTKRFTNVTRATVLAESTRVADNFFKRFRGLLWSEPLKQGEGLLIKPCNQIHMFGMKYAIDVVFMDKDWRVVATVIGIGPGKMSKMYMKAHSCIELPVGTIARSQTDVGDQMLVE